MHLGSQEVCALEAGSDQVFSHVGIYQSSIGSVGFGAELRLIYRGSVWIFHGLRSHLGAIFVLKGHIQTQSHVWDC